VIEQGNLIGFARYTVCPLMILERNRSNDRMIDLDLGTELKVIVSNIHGHCIPSSIVGFLYA
jgi:hypothetical protein